MKMQEMLKGYKPDLDSVQVAGNMVVIPLVSEQEFTNAVGEVNEVRLRRDIDYGSMEFENQSGRIGILMQGATIITRQSAQDRTIPRATILKGKGTERVHAFCVQSSQGGYMDASGIKDEFEDAPFQILPPTLRRDALMESAGGKSGYSRLWKSLERYSGTFHGVRSSSHLHHIYDRYKDSLDHFVAQFEPVPNQLGAIVLIDGAVVAVDIVPTYDSWKKVWRTLIRDSYGVEAVRTQAQEHGGGVVFNYALKEEEVTDLDSLEAEMHRAVSDLVNAIRQQWAKVSDESVVQQVEKTIEGVRLLKVKTGAFMGQAVVHDEHVVYMSLVPEGSTRENKPKFERKSKTYSNDDFSF